MIRGLIMAKPVKHRYFQSTSFDGSGVDAEKEIISGGAVITVGEALGHGMWIDGEMIDQVVEMGNAASKGLKARLAHPSLCADGMGTFLGRWKNFRRDGEVARADLHISKASHSAPQGDIGVYVLNIAEEDPEAFGSSIVFVQDVEAEAGFRAENRDDDGEFESPDEDNIHDLPHARILALHGADVVDEPAANPDGFFGMGDERAASADAVLSWLLGETDIEPAPQVLGGMAPGRLKEFWNGYLARHGLKVCKGIPDEEETGMAKNDEKVNAPKKATPQEMTAAFDGDPEFVLQCLLADMTIEEARTDYCVRAQKMLKVAKAETETLRKAQIELLGRKDEEIAALNAKIEDINKECLGGEAAPAGFEAEPSNEKMTMPKACKLAEELAAKNGTLYADEIRKIIVANPNIDDKLSGRRPDVVPKA